MSRDELQDFSERNWATVDPEVRKRCVEHLREFFSPDEEAYLRKCFESGEFPLGFHMFEGMGIRNVLREVVLDDQLPPVEYPGGEKYRNWDDYYMAALRQAVEEA